MHKYTHTHGSVCENITLLPNTPEAQMLINTCIFSPLSPTVTHTNQILIICFHFKLIHYSVVES